MKKYTTAKINISDHLLDEEKMIALYDLIGAGNHNNQDYVKSSFFEDNVIKGNQTANDVSSITTFNSNDNAATNAGNQSSIEIYNSTANKDAFMQFHIAGDYAAYFGLDGSTNDFFVGGYSMGDIKHKVWHSGNDGVGSGLDADKLDGLEGSEYLKHKNDRNYLTDSRGSKHLPSYYDGHYAQWDFQNQADTEAGGDAWHGVLTVAKWSSYNNSHRQEQLFFTGNDLKRRTANNQTSWGAIKTIWDSGNLVSNNQLSNGAGYATASNVVDLTNNQTVAGKKTFTDRMVIKHPEPTITFVDTTSGADDFYIHVNSNTFYVLADRDDSGGNNGVSSGWDGAHPLQLQSANNKSYTFGNEIYHTGNIPAWNQNTTGNAARATTADKIHSGHTGNLNTTANQNTAAQLTHHSFSGSATNKPPTSDNANSVITVGQHSGNYNAQLAFSSNGNMYWRDNPSSSFGSWRTVYDSGNLVSNSQLSNGASYLKSNADGTIGAGVTYKWTRTDTAGLEFVNNSYNTKLLIGGWSSSNTNNISRIRSSSGNLHIDSAANGRLLLNWYSNNNVESNRTIQSNADLRAPIFIDSTNTNYFLKPNNEGKESLKIKGGIKIDSSHSGGNIEIDYFHSSDTYSGNMVIFMSEPGVTHDGAGIGANISPSSPHYGRRRNHGYGVYLRFDKTSGNFEFWNTQGNAGSGGGRGSRRFWGDKNGNIFTAGDSNARNFILNSDIRLKEDIKKVENNHIDIDWKTFVMKSEKGQKRYGVIAQELEVKNPEFVRTDAEGMKSVAYIDLLIAKIAELEARLEKAGI